MTSGDKRARYKQTQSGPLQPDTIRQRHAIQSTEGTRQDEGPTLAARSIQKESTSFAYEQQSNRTGNDGRR